VLNDADLSESAFSDTSEEHEMEEVNIGVEIDDLRTTAKGAHVGKLNGLQIDCGTREIQGRVKERKERRRKRAGNENSTESVEGGERSNR